MPAHVYIMASRRNGTLYIGVTSNLVHRMHQHRNNHADGFTSKYCVYRLVHFELFADMPNAIAPEQAPDWKVEVL